MKTKRYKDERLSEGKFVLHNLLSSRLVGKTKIYTGNMAMAFDVLRCNKVTADLSLSAAKGRLKKDKI
ncbi:hypothetical protein ACNAUY_08120 [Acinetobacter tibetensis]|uniref:hypothetical protein n=1 Tax=Acinetobacter tibetensis TaxID=2943497 RepID=UPI003A4D487C